MNLKTKLMGLGLAAAAMALPMSAQDTGFYVGGNLSYASGMALKNQITRSDVGYVIDAGYVGKLAKTDVPLRTSLSMNFFPGSHDGQTASKVSLNGYQLASDLLIRTPLPKVRLITGLSINKWSLKVENDGEGSFTNNVKGLKFGGRLGFEYLFSPKLSGEVLLQVTELGTDQEFAREPDGKIGVVGLNPSWVQVGVKYHF